MDHQLSAPMAKRSRRDNSPPARPLPGRRKTAPGPPFSPQIGNQTAGRLIQAKLKIDQPGDRYESEADQVADRIVQQGNAGPSSSAVIQRQAAPETEPAPASPAGAQGALIVDDDAQQIGSGQMRKSEFLSRLKTEVCRDSEDAMKGTGRTTEGCPYVEKWFGYYAEKDSRYVERSLKKYAPEAAGATSASHYIPLVAARVRRSVEVWARTGEITGVPDELAGAVMGGGILDAIGSVVSTIGSAIGSVVSGIGSVLSGIGSLLFKPRDSGAATPRDSGTVAGALASGRTLDSPVRQRMEAAFGHDFSGVRIHTDSHAAGLSAGMNARAFTIGQQVAFGPGEYRPGTLVGDALIAHELAHVAQQSGAGARETILQKGDDRTGVLEEDADISAVKAVMSMWDGNARLNGMAERAMPSLRSGLRLQRCSRNLVPGANFQNCSKQEQSTVTESYNLARAWVTFAFGKLEAILAGQPDPDTMQQLDVHFHIKDATQHRDDIVKVRNGFARLQATFLGPVPFKCDTSNSNGGKSEGGGCLEGGVPIAEVPAFPALWGWVGDIHFYSDFFVSSVVGDELPGADTPAEVKAKAFKERAAIIIHEMAHKFLEVGDQQYYKGCKSREYAALSTKSALDNADSYAQFAHYVQVDK